MEADAVRAVSALRFAHAEECLADSHRLLEAGSWRSAVNRAYYAAFHAMRAVLVLDGIDMKHHSGIISEFRRLYIKTGRFDAQYSRTISELFNSRTGSDYDDYFLLTQEEALAMTESASLFVKAVGQYLASL